MLLKKIYYIGIMLWLSAISLSAQTRFDYFFLEAEKSRLNGDYPSAAELYRHALDIKPDASEALANYAILQFYMQQDSLGLSMLRKACESDSTNPWHWQTLATILLESRNYTEAVPVLEKMARLQTRRSDILSQLAHIYKGEGEIQKSIEALDRIELLEGKSMGLSMEKFSLYWELKEKEKAFQELQQLCAEFPHDLNYKVVLGNQYQLAGEPEKALDIYNEVKSVDPNNNALQIAMLDYYDNAGDTTAFKHLSDSLLLSSDVSPDLRTALMRDFVMRAQRDTTQAPLLLETFDRVLQLPQKDANILMLKVGYLASRNASKEELKNTFLKVLEVEPQNELALSQLLKYYALENDFKSMEDICRQGVNYYAEKLIFHYYLGLSLYEQDNSQGAIDAFRQGLRVKGDDESPEMISDLFAIMGDLYYQQNQPMEAFAAYDSALVYNETNVSCLNNYAYYLSLRNEQLNRAEEMSYRTIKAEPKNATYLDTYAWILFMQENYAEARIYIDRVVPSDVTDEDLLANELLSGNVFEHAGDIHIMCGNVEVALRMWNLALRKQDQTCSPNIEKKIKQKKYIK